MHVCNRHVSRTKKCQSATEPPHTLRTDSIGQTHARLSTSPFLPSLGHTNPWKQRQRQATSHRNETRLGALCAPPLPLHWRSLLTFFFVFRWRAAHLSSPSASLPAGSCYTLLLATIGQPTTPPSQCLPPTLDLLAKARRSEDGQRDERFALKMCESERLKGGHDDLLNGWNELRLKMSS